jgi:hypothetical protein
LAAALPSGEAPGEGPGLGWWMPLASAFGGRFDERESPSEGGAFGGRCLVADAFGAGALGGVGPGGGGPCPGGGGPFPKAHSGGPRPPEKEADDDGVASVSAGCAGRPGVRPTSLSGVSAGLSDASERACGLFEREWGAEGGWGEASAGSTSSAL